MITSIPVSDFMNAPPRSRAFNAIAKALEIKPDVQLVGQYETERYYRVKSPKKTRYCVIIWIGRISGEPVATCNCEAHFIPQEPTPCYHIAAALIWETQNELPATGDARAEGAVSTNGSRPKPNQVKRRYPRGV